MFTRITQLLQKNRRFKLFFIFICFSLLSIYPIFRNFYYGNGILTYQRHIAFLEKRSEFYNPWQYRVLCPCIIEGMLWTYDHTVDKVFPIEEKLHFKVESTTGTTAVTENLSELVQKKGAIKYMIVFIFFRYLEHMGIFLLSYLFWCYFIKNHWLIFFGLMFMTLSMGNAVAVADLTFNTYIDIILYLLTACVIVYRKSQWWLLPIIILGAFNRETSIMIPFLYFITMTDFRSVNWKHFRISDVQFPKLQVWLITALAYIIFFSIFVGLRIHYGFRPQQVWKVPAGLPMLKLNLFSTIGLKSYFEMIGTFAVIPLIILYKFRQFPYLLKLWFIAIVPVWFAVHLLTVVTYQTRLFLVPEILIFLPMMLWLIENSIRKNFGLERN
jgi:hypothetical protein